jgi:signal transduction histidine kinase
VNIAALALDSAAVLCITTPDGWSTEQLMVAHPAGRSGELAEAMSRSTQCHEPGLLRRTVMEQGKILSGANTGRIPPEHHRRFLDQTGWSIEHSVSAPIRHNGEVLGFFSVFRSDPRARFEVGDDDLVQILADRIGGVFAESRLRRATEVERDQRLRKLVDQQKELLDDLAGMETRERSLLAESIHDEPIQLIVASIMRIDRMALRAQPAEREELDKIASQLEVSVDWLRNLIVVALTPPELSEGLGIALADLADGIFLGSTTFCLEGPHDVTLSEGAKAAAFRILREALVNTRKHAMAQNVTLRMSEHDGIVNISLTDDGVGTERIESASGHLGMATMRARADAEGGVLRVDSAPGLGTTVTLTLPAAPGTRS